MSQPTPYSRQYNFTNYQAVNPSTPLPAAQVDLELNSVKATLDQVLNNLKLIQRDDTALANNSVGQDQLKDEIFIGINPPAPWVTAHAYIKNDTTTHGGIFYACLVSHTSGTFATDLGAGDWSLIIDFNGLSFDLATSIHGAVAKTIPNDSDEFAQADSANLWSLKKTTWANFKAAMFAAWGALIAVGTVKSTPVDGDAFAYMDSASSNATKVTTWASIKSVIFTALGPLIAAATAKATPIGADMLLLADSAASNASKFTTLSNFFAAVFTALGPLIAAATGKSTPVDTDGLLLTDSAASGAGKLLTWANLKATLKTYLDTLYSPLGASVYTLLGTISTTSGASQGLTGLSLTSYKTLHCVFDGVSFAGAANLLQNGSVLYAAAGGANQAYGTYDIDLINSVGVALIADLGNSPVSRVNNSAVAQASTSITFATSAAAFDAGDIRVYGVK